MDALRNFYEAHRGWEAYQRKADVLSFFQEHPDWRRVRSDILAELAERITTRMFRSVAYAYDYPFFPVALIAEKFDVVRTNFIKISDDHDGIEGTSAAGKLWTFAWTLQQLGSRIMREVDQMGEDVDRTTVSDAIEDAKVALEACLTVDPFFVTAYVFLPLTWIAKNGDYQRAVAICDEGIKACRAVHKNQHQLPSELDREMAKGGLEAACELEKLAAQIRSSI